MKLTKITPTALLVLMATVFAFTALTCGDDDDDDPVTDLTSEGCCTFNDTSNLTATAIEYTTNPTTLAQYQSSCDEATSTWTAAACDVTAGTKGCSTTITSETTSASVTSITYHIGEGLTDEALTTHEATCAALGEGEDQITTSWVTKE